MGFFQYLKLFVSYALHFLLGSLLIIGGLIMIIMAFWWKTKDPTGIYEKVFSIGGFILCILGALYIDYVNKKEKYKIFSKSK